ncbi:MAG: hypothetical protein HZA23_01970 [Nitrospirae bacterium]|nr:hypothetical protein [Nitrospirota bacterium]
MRVEVNGQALDLLPGMTVRHALIQSGLLGEVEAGKKVYDIWGNEVGLEGALIEGMVLKVR